MINYKVLATIKLKGNKIEFREYEKHWSVAIIDKHGNTKEIIRNEFAKAKWTYQIQTHSLLSK